MTNLLTIRIGGLTETNARYLRRAAAARDLTEPLRTAGVLARDAGVRRIKIGGDPKWIPSQRALRTNGTTGIRTGAMIGSIVASEPVIAGTQGSVRAGVSGPAARYAVVFQRGRSQTGRAQAMRQRIRGKKALSWTSGGHGYIARGIGRTRRGNQPPRPFMYVDEDLKRRVERAFRVYLRGTMEAR